MGLSSFASADEGRLKANDTVKLTVFQEDDLNLSTKILKSGEASFNLIGPVKIAGLTVPEATEVIRSRYAADFLVDPQVTLTIETYAAQYVAVVGEVKTPGRIAYPENGKLDLLTAIGQAGGLLESADKSQIVLVRGTSKATYKMDSLQKGGAVALEPNDQVSVLQNSLVKKTVTILGEVKKPGAVEFPLDGSLDLITGIAMAGGFSDIANQKKVTISRNGQVETLNPSEMSSNGGLRKLQPGDIVNVAERRF